MYYNRFANYLNLKNPIGKFLEFLLYTSARAIGTIFTLSDTIQ
ncbi:hypothetical protein A33Q_0364 [Indibacter alkaliphilus LW1]|uniref:Uncharacterized protein n=1 Tax=Indibacter alkaliphilus (strain CCUG 57479 / KCTC 22604 / LW1) TaxID=1189612 RepID=S2EBE5_INDAL|nr:hypothetical protein A33Q_0364 [Indibacter alkaliphilus LW1]